MATHYLTLVQGAIEEAITEYVRRKHPALGETKLRIEVPIGSIAGIKAQITWNHPNSPICGICGSAEMSTYPPEGARDSEFVCQVCGARWWNTGFGPENLNREWAAREIISLRRKLS